MYRLFLETLKKWYSEKKPKPLLVCGARQTGKTWIIDHFCETSGIDYLKINLESQKEYLSVFEESLDPRTVLQGIEMLSGRRVDEKCLLFIDEIQQSERAITALKYFYEAIEGYHVIGAGSLLGVKLSRFQTSFPVGKVDIHNFYPMTFEEFLIAVGEEPLRDGICQAYETRKPLPQGIHEKALRMYRDYLFVGGMPELVNEYRHTNCSLMAMNQSLLPNLQLAYQADMTKYTLSAAEGVKISEVYRSLPRQLARDNPKFKYKDVRPRANKRDFASSLDWLINSGMVYAVRKVVSVSSPLKVYEDENSMKLYLSDVGLLTNTVGLRIRDILPNEHNIFKGALAENFIVQQFAAAGTNLHYFKPSEKIEIDLLYDHEDGVIPVEIKAGRHKRSTSLSNYRAIYHPPYAIRFSENQFGESDGLLSLPLYMIFCIF